MPDLPRRRLRRRTPRVRRKSEKGTRMKQLTHVASRFINTPLMLHPPKLEVIIKALGPRLGIDAQLVPRSEAPAVLMERYDSAGGDDAEYQVVDGVAVIS